jgi:hypothetical protein
MIDNYYTESISIMTRTTSTGWNDEVAWSTSALVDPFLGAINPMGGHEVLAEDKKTVLADWKLFCSDTVNFYERDHLKWSGKTFDVVFIKDTFNFGHHKNVLLKKLDG